MKVTMVSHASVLIEAGPIVLLTDPWCMGEVFNEAWSLLCTPALTPTTLQGVTHIWISHEHPDHLHFPTLQAIPAEQKSTVTMLYVPLSPCLIGYTLPMPRAPSLAAACLGLLLDETARRPRQTVQQQIA